MLEIVYDKTENTWYSLRYDRKYLSYFTILQKILVIVYDRQKILVIVYDITENTCNSLWYDRKYLS